MIDYRNSTHQGHIITVEDPIEFVHQHKKSIITQREVGFDTMNFQNALKNTLRQAPDVILIGEVRDTETMEAAITFAETGHLCIATLTRTMRTRRSNGTLRSTYNLHSTCARSFPSGSSPPSTACGLSDQTQDQSVVQDTRRSSPSPTR